MKTKLILAVLCLGGTAAPINAATYLYDISASISSDPSSSITGSFTFDDSVGAASISNVDVHATLPLVGGPFNFSFSQVVNPVATWSVGYLWFAKDGFGAGDTYFRMYVNYDSAANDGSYLIGIGGDPANPHQSEISVIGVNDWQDIFGRMTPELAAVPEPSTWAMMILGFAGIGFMAYRRRKVALA
jgi:hypothetical protein